MSVLEITLILMGIIIFIGSFLIPVRKETQKTAETVDEQMIRDMVDREVQEAQTKIGDIVDETITYAMEKTERSMDRLTNEKMLAVNEYSDTVLGEINKNHQEVVFLYDMLNDKHENLKTTAAEAEKTVQKVRETVKDAQHSVAPLTQGTPATEVQTAGVQQMQQEEPVQQRRTLSRIQPEASVTAEQAAGIPSEVTAQGEDEAQAQPETFVRMRPETLTQIQPEAFVQTQSAAEADLLRQQKEEIQETAVHGQQAKVAQAENAQAEALRKRLADKSAQVPLKEAKPAKKKRSVTTKSAEVQNGPEVTVSLDRTGAAGKRNNNERILELHRSGKSNMAIAKELGLGIGEVKLVIDLFEGM